MERRNVQLPPDPDDDELEEELEDRIVQIMPPDPTDTDPHPRLLLDGWGIHAGETLTALFPDGWRKITLEMRWEVEGPACWYISTPGYRDFSPIGLFVNLDA